MKRILRSPAVTGLLFLMALILLLFGSVGGTRAALNLESSIYESQMNTTSIGVSIREGSETLASNNGPVSGVGVMKLSAGDMAARAGDDVFKIGKTYNLPLSVYNSGNIEEYVRVTIYKYWVTPAGTAEKTGWFSGSGTKDRTLKPELIVLEPDPGWTEDTEARTDERSVFYYSGPLASNSSVQFLNSVKVDSKIVDEIQIGPDGKEFYTYDGMGFVLEIQVDAVQTHNGNQARVSSWGLYK